MNLKAEISLDSIKNLFGKKKYKSGGELKTTINFVGIEEKETNWLLAIPGIIVILIVSVMISKFGVIDRYAKLSAAQAEAAAMEGRVKEGMEKIASAGDLTDQFYHYTWTGMTDEEIMRESRVKIANLISFINGQGLSVKSYALTGPQLSVIVRGSSLDQISQVLALVRKEKIVETCSVSMAQMNTDEQSASTGVDAQLNIFIRALSSEPEQTAETEAAEENADTAGTAGGDGQ